MQCATYQCNGFHLYSWYSMIPGVMFPGVICTTSPGRAQLEHVFGKNFGYTDIAEFSLEGCGRYFQNAH